MLLLAAAGHGQARTLTILAPDLPGAVAEGGVGRDAESVRSALRLCGYEAQFIVQPFGRHILTYQSSDTADAVMTVPLGQDLPGYSTSAYIWYQNGAVYDVNRLDRVDGIESLFGHDVVTFKNGISILELEDLQSRFGSLFEVTNQKIHSHLLLLGRVDAVLADGLIVANVNRQLLESADLVVRYVGHPRFEFSPIFQPTPYKMVFRQQSLAKAFDRCFDEAYSVGVIEEINERYIRPFQDLLGHRYLGL